MIKGLEHNAINLNVKVSTVRNEDQERSREKETLI
jgi:hypothetical protein